jgi:hypothetical protein
VQTLGEKPLLLENRSGIGNRWVGLQLLGTSSNRDGIGAAVTVKTTTGSTYHFANRTGSYLSANDPRIVAGIGNDEPVLVEIRWPSGRTQQLERPGYNRYLKITEPE